MTLFIRVCICCLVCVGLMGCSSTPSTGINTGVQIDLFVEQADSMARYIANSDGTIDFAGGTQARRDTTQWTGEMTGEEIDAMLALMESPFWRERRRDSGTPGDGEQRFDITIRSADIRNRLVIRSTPERTPQDVIALHDLLQSAAAKRFDPVLRELPTAGPLRTRNR